MVSDFIITFLLSGAFANSHIRRMMCCIIATDFLLIPRIWKDLIRDKEATWRLWKYLFTNYLQVLWRPHTQCSHVSAELHSPQNRIPMKYAIEKVLHIFILLFLCNCACRSRFLERFYRTGYWISPVCRNPPWTGRTTLRNGGNSTIRQLSLEINHSSRYTSV